MIYVSGIFITFYLHYTKKGSAKIEKILQFENNSDIELDQERIETTTNTRRTCIPYPPEQQHGGPESRGCREGLGEGEQRHVVEEVMAGLRAEAVNAAQGGLGRVGGLVCRFPFILCQFTVNYVPYNR